MNGEALELAAPAKLNLGLRITGRRSDGYHELESLFVPLSLCDTLRLTPRDAQGIRLQVTGEASPADATNLAWRAADAFLAEPAARGGIEIELEKRIPSPGGLGGGSSDAGAVLRGLAQLQPGAVEPDRLAALAVALGADVPFFLDPCAALVEGIGEQIEPVAGMPSLWLALAHPARPLATPDVFAGFDAGDDSLTGSGARPTIRRLLALRGAELRIEGLNDLDRAGWQALLANDLEPTAGRLCPEVVEMRKEFEATQALAVGMSGSGPTVYGVFSEPDAAQDAANRLAGKLGFRTWVARTTP